LLSINFDLVQSISIDRNMSELSDSGLNHWIFDQQDSI